MIRFTSRPIPLINGHQKFEELVIIDKHGIEHQVFSEFSQTVEEKYKSSIKSLMAIMELVADLQTVPQTKFKEITPASETVKEYEFKFRDLRVYAIRIPGGKLLCLAGYKNSQQRDIRRFRGLKKQYLMFINSKYE